MTQSPRITPNTAHILLAFQADPSTALYATEIHEMTGLPRPSVLAILKRLRAAGMVAAEPESGGGDDPVIYRDEAAKIGRRRRIYYTLTDAGRAVADRVTAAQPAAQSAGELLDVELPTDSAQVKVNAQLAEQLGRHVLDEVASSAATHRGETPDAPDSPFTHTTARRVGAALYQRGFAAGAGTYARRVRDLTAALDTARRELADIEQAYSNLAARVRSA